MTLGGDIHWWDDIHQMTIILFTERLPNGRGWVGE